MQSERFNKNFWNNRAKRYPNDELASVCSPAADRYVNEYIDRTHKRAIKEILKISENAKFLDAGCGTGRWTHWFKELKVNVVGIDISESMVKAAHRFRKSKENSEFFVGTITQLGIKNGVFDLVFSSYVLQHIVRDKDFRKAAKEFVRVTKPKGKIAVLDIISRRPSKRKATRFVNLRCSEEYKVAFEKAGASFVFEVGVRLIPLYFLYERIWRRILKIETSNEINMSERFWQAIRKSKWKQFFDAGMKVILKIQSSLDFLGRKLPFFSLERLLLFDVKK